MKSSFMSKARRIGRNVSKAVARQIRVGAVGIQTTGASMSKSEQRFVLGLMLSASLANQAMAQSVTTTQAAVTSVKALVFLIVQGIFVALMAIQLVKVVKKVMGGEPDAMTSFMWLIGGVLVFFGFSAFKTSLVGGGTAGNGTADGLLGQ